MCSGDDLAYLIVVLLVPLPALQHFIYPLLTCMDADLCNHTWIPECAVLNISGKPVTYRLFTDLCDLDEYNCDNYKSYNVTNYAECFINMKSLVARSGDYKFYPERWFEYVPQNIPSPTELKEIKSTKRKSILEVFRERRQRILTASFTTTTTKKTTIPLYMRPGKRRYTPMRRRGLKKRPKTRARSPRTMPRPTQPPTKILTTKKATTTRKQTKTRPKFVTITNIKKQTVMKNGKMVVKVIKTVMRTNKGKQKKYVPPKDKQTCTKTVEKECGEWLE